MAYDSLMVFTACQSQAGAGRGAASEYSRWPRNRWPLQRRRVRWKSGENVRGKDVFVLQSTCSPPTTRWWNCCAGRRVEAGVCRRITAAIPSFGYARQDRRPRSVRVPITAKVVANMLTSVVIDRCDQDLHSDQFRVF